MAKKKNDQLEIFRLKIRTAMRQYVDKMKIFIAEEKAAGSSIQDIKEMKADEYSSWNKEKDSLKRFIKQEAAGLINRLHIKAYLAGIK